MKIREKKYLKEVKKLVDKYNNASTNGEKALIYLQANNLKSKCAMDTLYNKVRLAFYCELFKVEETNANRHYLDVWSKT